MGYERPGATYDLDCSDLDEVRRRVVEPAVRSLLRDDEVDSIEVFVGPPPGMKPAFKHDAPEVWLRLTAGGSETFERRLCKATDQLWDAWIPACDLYDALGDWLVETRFAWGECRSGELVVPPPTHLD